MATTALLWAVHDDFLRYMARIEDGQVAVVDGAEQLPDGRFRFPVRGDAGPAEGGAPGPLPQSGGSTRFRGAVVCTGHHGMLAVTLAAPELVLHEETAALVIDDPFSPGDRMPMAHLHPSGEDPCRFEAHLSEEGADLFQGVYATGMALATARLEQRQPAARHAPDDSAPVSTTPAGSTIPSTEDPS